MTNLEGKVAIVTGGSRGIGKTIAEKLQSLGAKVYVVGITDSEDLKGLIFKQCDVSVFEEVESVFKEIHKEAGQIDILVNNAGITKDNLLIRISEQDWDDVINVNLKGVFNTCKNIARVMMGQRSGRIINIGSIVGTTGNAGQVNYSSSKAGLVGLTKSLAKELGSRNVLVNLIAPGFVETEMTQKLNDEQLKAYTDNIPLKRAGQTSDIADVVAFFASDESRYVTGQVLHVDGGLAM